MLPAVYNLHFHNGSQGPLDQFMVQFNKNSFGLAPATQNIPMAQVAAGSSQTAALPLTLNANMLSPAAANSTLQVGSARLCPAAARPAPAGSVQGVPALPQTLTASMLQLDGGWLCTHAAVRQLL